MLLALVPVVISGLEKTPRDKVGISYGGGPSRESHFQRIVQPGSSLFWNGVFDSLYLYPADQQNYIISKTTAEGSRGRRLGEGPVHGTGSRSSTRWRSTSSSTPTCCSEFHEQLGLKYNAYTPTGGTA